MSDKSREAAIESAHTLFCQMSSAKKGLNVALDSLMKYATEAARAEYLPQIIEARRLIGFMTNEKIAEAARALDELITKQGE